MNEPDKKRCNSLLATLAFAGQGTPRYLRAQLETVHGVAVTQARVEADLRTLADIGAVTYNPDLSLAQITHEGREHAQQLRELF